MNLGPFDLQATPIILGADRRAREVSGSFSELEILEDERILALFDFHDDHSLHADQWERHPAGDELLYVLRGRLLATVDRDGVAEDVVIEAGQAFIVPRQLWHRLRALEPGRLLALTPAAGSELRPHTP